MAELRIESIADHPDRLEMIARWYWDEWGAYLDPTGSPEGWLAGLRERTTATACRRCTSRSCAGCRFELPRMVAHPIGRGERDAGRDEPRALDRADAADRPTGRRERRDVVNPVDGQPVQRLPSARGRSS